MEWEKEAMKELVVIVAVVVMMVVVTVVVVAIVVVVVEDGKEGWKRHTRPLDTAKRKLNSVIHRKIIDADHTRTHPGHDSIEIPSILTKDATAQTVFGGIGNRNSVIDIDGFHNETDGRKRLLAGNVHRSINVDE